MNLIEKWKTRETKKKLREENRELKAELHDQMIKKSILSQTLEKNTRTIRSSIMIKPNDIITVDDAKDMLKRDLMEIAPSFIEWYLEDDHRTGDRILTGTLYVVMGDRKYGS